jgi:hypothetical protein
MQSGFRSGKSNDADGALGSSDANAQRVSTHFAYSSTEHRYFVSVQ